MNQILIAAGAVLIGLGLFGAKKKDADEGLTSEPETAKVSGNTAKGVPTGEKTNSDHDGGRSDIDGVG